MQSVPQMRLVGLAVTVQIYLQIEEVDHVVAHWAEARFDPTVHHAVEQQWQSCERMM
jgi:hypothetical protein